MREHTLQAMPYKGEIHKKAWGHELWIINNEHYCGKLLVFKEGKSFSMHYHLLKDEAWYISKGKFLYKYIDTETAEQLSVEVTEGDCIHLMPGQPTKCWLLKKEVVYLRYQHNILIVIVIE